MNHVSGKFIKKKSKLSILAHDSNFDCSKFEMELKWKYVSFLFYSPPRPAETQRTLQRFFFLIGVKFDWNSLVDTPIRAGFDFNQLYTVLQKVFQVFSSSYSPSKNLK